MRVTVRISNRIFSVYRLRAFAVMAGKIGRLESFDSAIGIRITNVWSSTLFAMKLRQKESNRFTYVDWWKHLLLRGLTRPKKPAEVSYGDLVAALRKHLCPKPLVIVERFRFHKREQEDYENILDYVAALRK